MKRPEFRPSKKSIESVNLFVDATPAVKAGEVLIAQKSRMEIAVRRTLGQVIDIGLALGLSTFTFTIASWLYKPGPHVITFTLYSVTFDAFQVMFAVMLSPLFFMYFRWWFKSWSHSVTPGEMLTGIASYYLPERSSRRFVELEFAHTQYLQFFFSGFWAFAAALAITLIMACIAISIGASSVSILPFLHTMQIVAAGVVFIVTYIGSNYPKTVTDPRSSRDLQLGLYVKSCGPAPGPNLKLKGENPHNESAEN